MTSPVFFEKHIEDPRINNTTLIRLSELRRFDDGTVEGLDAYYEEFVRVSHLVRYNRIRIHSHPVFTWHGLKSTNWNFEKLNVEVELSNRCDKLALELKTDYKEAVKMCERSKAYRLSALSSVMSMGWIPSDMKVKRIVQTRFHLSRLFETMSAKYYNMFLFRENKTAIKYAYQYGELASRLWGGNIANFKYKALYLKSIADSLSDEQIGEKIALLNKVIGETYEGVPESIYALQKSLMQVNDQVYFKVIKTELKPDVMSLSEAFRVLLPSESEY
jgi:hypothetical protein